MSDIDWSFPLLEELIQDRGDEVIHETAVSCPSCRVEDVYASNTYIEGQPGTASNGQAGCPDCGGTGWRYRDAKIIKGLITGFKTGPNPTLTAGGYLDAGDCMFSPSLNVGPITDWDKITSQIPAPVNDGQTIVRGAATFNTNTQLNTGLTQNQDRLWYLPACIIWCEDQYGTVYRPGIDFTLTGKVINWVGSSPAINTVYTVKYQAFHEFVVFATPFIRYDRGRSLAPAVGLKKSHVVFTNAYNLDSPKKRAENQVLFTMDPE